MAIKYDNVIVFGPTGQTGAAAAQEAGARGAKVWLAMRDTNKSIPKLDESKGRFERIAADLSDVESVKKALEKSKAKAAYIYIVRGADHKANFQALKAAGVEWVVLLSSFTIVPTDPDGLRKIPEADGIPYHHAQAEIVLEDVGLAHAALRPGSFASNLLFQDMTTGSKVRLFSGDTSVDGIVPVDIGYVAGAVLVDRPSDKSKEIIYITGPKLLKRREMWDIVEKVTGNNYDIYDESSEEFKQRMSHAPASMIDYQIRFASEYAPSQRYPDYIFPTGHENIRKYAGKEPTPFEAYVRDNKELFKPRD